MENPLAGDLENILHHTPGVWDELRGARLFITGGTGFFGCWLLESFAWANRRLDLGAKAVVLTRDAAAFRKKAPHLAKDPAIHFHPGDVRTFDFLPGRFSHMIHAATESTSGLNERDPLSMLDSIIAGTRHTLDFAVVSGARKFLLTSSGAVYGKQPPEITHVPETFPGGPDTMDPRSAYAEGKRVAELLCAIYHQRHGLEAKIARCFAFVGPHLPLDAHFAIGNFISDAIAKRPIEIKGDGTPYRSYLYAADLATWLWMILVRGKAGRPYNVGAEDDIQVRDAARTVGGEGAVQTAKPPLPGVLPARYVPSTLRARTEISLRPWVPLQEAIDKTIAWIEALEQEK